MIRPWRPEDAAASYAVYFDAVRNGASRHYDAEQRRAWAPNEVMEPWWPERLSAGSAWVSEDRDGMTGVIALAGGDHLDLFFVAPRARGDGTAVALYDALMREAASEAAGAMTAYASDYLKPFLEKRGWRTIREELNERDGVTLRRWAMARGGL